MSNTDQKFTKNLMEHELNFFNLLETTYCLLKAYIIWSYFKWIRITKIDLFINLVKIIISAVKTRINNNKSQRNNLLKWIRTKVKEPLSPTNFREDWRDGILLCALIEGIVPGSCPRYDLLNPDQAINNINLGLTLIRKHLNVDSSIESREIHDCSEEAKLVYLLSRVKFESIKLLMKSLIKRPIVEVKDSSGNSHKVFESLFGDEKACFAKGMGLILGVRTRRARFNIFCKPTPKLNLMIEISGPNNTMCSEKITVYNPRKRISADVVTSSLISDYLSRKKSSEAILKIPFFYEVFANRIVITYIPLMTGIHKLSIIWQGQHILNSPYTVKVEECNIQFANESDPANCASSPTKFIPGLQYPMNALARSDSLSLDECATVVGRKVLKQTVIINGKQQIVCDFNKEIINTINEFNDNYEPKSDTNITEINDKNDSIDSEYFDKTEQNISRINSHSRKLNKLIINELNRNTDLFDIKESDSIHSDTYLSSSATNDRQNNKSIEYIDNKQDFELSKKDIEIQTNSNYEKEEKNNCNENSKNLYTYDKIGAKETANMSQNLINYSYNRTYVPVKNMIQNWETKLSKNINENNDREYKERNKIQPKIPLIPVRNRCAVFENHIQTVSSINENQFPIRYSPEVEKRLDSDNSVPDKPIVDEYKEEDMTESNDSNNIKENINYSPNSDQLQNTSKYEVIESESTRPSETLDIYSPESHPDSGICTQLFTDFKSDSGLAQKMLRRKSLSYPNLKIMDTKCLTDSEIKYTDNNTQTSSVNSGQYIDDEIPDYSNLFLGQYVSYTGLLNSDRPIDFDDIKFDDLFEVDNDLNDKNQDSNSTEDLGIYAHKCEVFGAGAYYGQVGVKNSFVVSTKDSGKSYLSVGVQSAESDSVIGVSFTSIGNDKYEVQYEVSRPGYYVIFVKWGDYNIADSPFICKVTF